MTPEELTELLAQMSNDPKVIDGLERSQLEEVAVELESAIRGYATAVKEKTSDDPRADLEAGTEAKERLAAVKVKLAEFEAEDSENETAAEALVEDLPESVEEETAEAAETEEETTEEAPEAEEETTEESEEEESKELETVAAAKPSIGALAKRTPKLADPEPVLVASAGPMIRAEGFESPAQLGEAALRLWKSFGSSNPQHQERHLVASFNTLDNYKYQVNGDQEHDAKIIDELLAEIEAEARKDASQAALVASGGFCAPAQPVYDFFSISATEGMIQLPTVGAPRGRLTYPVSSSYATIRDTAAWNAALANEHTNTEDEAGATKPNYAVTCPDTISCEVAAYSNILEFGNFAQRFYSEHVAHAMAESATFAAHKVNGTLIAAMVAAAAAVGGGDPGGGTLVNVAQILSFEAAKYRDNFRMSPGASLELVSPTWVLDALASDLIARDSTQTFENAKGRVRSVFAGFDLNVQFVQDWQSIADNDFGGYPDSVDFLLYAPGTFIRMDEGRLDLGIVRDSTLNATNDFQTFDESFEGVCEVGHESWLIDDVTICPTGSTGARVTVSCAVGS